MNAPKRKRAEEALRESEEKYRTLIESSSDCICHIDLDGKFVYMNPGGVKLNELESPNDLIGHDCTIGIHEEYKDLMKDAIERAKKGLTTDLEYKSTNAKGKDLWWESIVGPIKGEGGKVISLVRISRDVTDRKHVEEALHESEERYRSLFEGAPNSIVLINSETGALVEFNDHAHENLGFTREEFQKLKIPDFEVIESAEEVAQHIEKIVNEGADIFETKHRRKNGQILNILVISRTIHIKGEHFVQSIWTDITEHKLAEKKLKEYSIELEQSNRLKDMFIDIMKHDLLNPASAANNMADMALGEEEDPKKKEILQLISKTNKRIISIIESAAVFATLESGEKLDFKERDLGDFLRSAINDMTRLAEEKEIKIVINGSGEFKALVNPLIYNVFSNLIGNAIKYCPEDCKIVIKIEEDNNNWKISVADCGEGIQDMYKKTIFERFKRVQKGGVKGSGLGLAIVKGVVEAHNGRVWVEDNPGGGSIFYLTLPKL